ncbi:hypothetical protein ABZX69_41505, partial [Streptomyces sp. NPDC004074]|uniref:hypothetical protein n=1 Tax=Streptomyces sp. NPDC004074 TaxID=3154277 RepID=UPI0033B90FE5
MSRGTLGGAAASRAGGGPLTAPRKFYGGAGTCAGIGVIGAEPPVARETYPRAAPGLAVRHPVRRA